MNVLVSKEASLNEHVDTMIDKEIYITKAARYLKEDIIYYAKTLPELSSTADELCKDLRKPPQSVTLFLSEL